MFTLNHRIRNSLLILVAGLILFGGGILWGIQDHEGHLNRILANFNINAQTAAEIAVLDVLRRDSGSADKMNEVLARAVPERASLVALPARIAALGETSDVGATASFGVEEEGLNNKPSAIELSVFLGGRQQAINKFLKELENTLPLVEIQSFDLSAAAESGKLQGLLKTRVFFR